MCIDKKHLHKININSSPSHLLVFTKICERLGEYISIVLKCMTDSPIQHQHNHVQELHRHNVLPEQLSALQFQNGKHIKGYKKNIKRQKQNKQDRYLNFIINDHR